ncbi:signal peptidase I [Faecalicoccus pleomorphus]|uniref:Signal peptidase I n=1 Tax=Faecalicoccus pleomorphus TaxID=1323 RepID=A0A3E3E502_9FIRM|nr:signal peptidase I [Faecalicoccus pleomorphus]
MEEIRFFLMRAGVLLLILYIMFGWIFGLHVVNNLDMQPKIFAGDLSLFYRLDPSYNIGEVLVYQVDGKTYLGRVVARAGDEVDITEDNHLKINGDIMIESDIYYETGRYENGISLPVKVPADSYFLLCDLREGGKDSRIFGPISRSDIKGKVITILRRSNL